MKIYTHEPDYFERTPAEKQRFCMTCYHYQPVEEKGRTNIICNVDGHYISYIQASEQWCRRWKKANWTRYEDEEKAIEQVEHDSMWEPTFNAEDGSM